MPLLTDKPKKTARETPRIYVLEFSDGTIKVGRSCDVRNRVHQLQWDPFRIGKSVVRGWCSEGISGAEEAEMRLILFCRERFGSPTPRTAEHFSGDYDLAVAFAQSLVEE